MSDQRPIAVGSAGEGHPGRAPLTLVEAAITTAWNVQGDPTRAPFIDEVEQLFGVRLPTAANTTAKGGALLALWLGPRSWLLMHAAGAESSSSLMDFEEKRDALNARGGALFDVSASRVAFTLRGAHAATVLAQHCPLDFHLRAFPLGGCAQSLFGHVNALFHRPEATSFTMMVARSFTRDAWETLRVSAAQDGRDLTPPGSTASS
ncbi:MAG: sarcosine oxidase subunit gamma family protein [Betaproteobacteria bacterium]